MIDRWDRWPLSAMVVTGLCAGLYANGFDSALGQSLACLLSSIALCLALAAIKPGADFWAMARWPLLLFAVALLWLLIVDAVRWTLPLSEIELPIAPDLFLAKFLSIVAGLWALLTGALFGWKRPPALSAPVCLVVLLTAHILLGLVLLLGILPGNGLWAGWTVMKDGRFTGLVGNANVTAAMCAAGAVLSLAFAMSLWNSRRAKGWRRQDGLVMIGLLAAGLLHLIALVMTASRFPVMMTLIAFLLLALAQKNAAKADAWRFWPPAVAVFLAVIVSHVLFSDLLLTRAGNLVGEAYARGEYWRHFFDMAANAPLTGYGPSAFPTANLYFLQSATDAVGTSTINSPHSIVLQLWFVGGAPYLLLMLAGAGLIGRDILFRRGLWRWDVRDIGVLLASLAIMACGLVDIVLDYPVGTQIAFFLLGFAWMGGGERGAVAAGTDPIAPVIRETLLRHRSPRGGAP
ncbi:MAG TPA: O-antigen ligase family protein [Sphingobium sp.]